MEHLTSEPHMISGAIDVPCGAAGRRTGGAEADAMTPSATGYSFFVPGDCVPWARAAGGKTAHRFTPARQANYMIALKRLCEAAMRGVPPLEGPIRLDLAAAYPWPKSIPAKKRIYINSWRTSRPDFDNIAKIVGDALNNIAWRDDAQISAAYVRKFYSDRPGLNVEFKVLG